MFLEARPDIYANIFDRVMSALEQISPVVEERASGCAFLDLSGLPDSATPSHEVRLARAIQCAVKEVAGLPSYAGIADTRFAAWVAAATAGRAVAEPCGPAAKAGAVTDTGIHVVARDGSAPFFTSLPIHRLPVSDEMRRRLRWLGYVLPANWPHCRAPRSPPNSGRRECMYGILFTERETPG